MAQVVVRRIRLVLISVAIGASLAYGVTFLVLWSQLEKRFVFFPVAELIAYFRCVRRSLAPGGIFMVDGYGGWDSQQQLSERRTIKSPGGTFGYVWEQADFNPVDNRALCYIHFEFKGGKKMKRAFTYDWRVYSPPEVRDALSVAGFRKIDVLWDVEESEAISTYRRATRAENCPGWLVYIVAER